MYYKLNGKIPVRCSMQECNLLLNDVEARRVAFTDLGTYSVSTVFLCLDHAMFGGPPMLFETMVFGDGITEADDSIVENGMRRYSTWDEAEAGHNEMVAEIRRKQFKVINGKH